MMKLIGIHTGYFEAEYVMDIPEEEYNKFLAENPGYDIEEDPDEIWSYFKKLGYEDEIEDSCDYDTTLSKVEVEK